MSNYGYSHGNPFGDPEGFTRSTQESEIDQFNRWMRSQPWWAAAQHNPQAVEQQLAAMGIHLPGSFHIDEAGNLNQKSRAGTVAKYAAIGGLAATGLGAAGIGPLAGLFAGGAGAAGAGASAIPALEGGGTLAANLGAASALPAFSAASIPALAGGATLAGNLGADSALAGLSGTATGTGMIGPIAGAAGTNAAEQAMGGGGTSIAETVAKALGHGNGSGSGFSASDLIKLLGAGGLAAYGATQNHGNAYPPELDQILALQKQRMESQTPLYNSILKLSQSRLPTSVQG